MHLHVHDLNQLILSVSFSHVPALLCTVSVLPEQRAALPGPPRAVAYMHASITCLSLCQRSNADSATCAVPLRYFSGCSVTALPLLLVLRCWRVPQSHWDSQHCHLTNSECDRYGHAPSRNDPSRSPTDRSPSRALLLSQCISQIRTHWTRSQLLDGFATGGALDARPTSS